jgi:hypothetical protein
MKICKHCGQSLPYNHIRYDYNHGGSIKIIGKSYDDEIFDIWKVDGQKHLKDSDAKQGRWEDRRKLFGKD